jgi:hypothetical protein
MNGGSVFVEFERMAGTGRVKSVRGQRSCEHDASPKLPDHLYWAAQRLAERVMNDVRTMQQSAELVVGEYGPDFCEVLYGKMTLRFEKDRNGEIRKVSGHLEDRNLFFKARQIAIAQIKSAENKSAQYSFRHWYDPAKVETS